MKAIEVGRVPWTQTDLLAWLEEFMDQYEVLITHCVQATLDDRYQFRYQSVMRAVPKLDGVPMAGFAFRDEMWLDEHKPLSWDMLAKQLFRLVRQIEDSFDELYVPAGS